MQKVFVLSKNKKPLMPCHPSRARELLTQGKAAVFKLYPFTIILKKREEGVIQEIEVKIDPGSKVSGIVLVGHFPKRQEVLFAANLEHRGEMIRSSLISRRALRRSRRYRKTRYRAARFNNRTRKEGWLPPSLQSRVDNIVNWIKRLEIDHIVPKSKGGSNRVYNLTIVCRDCNSTKANNSLQEFLKNKPILCCKILEKAKTPLNNAAAVNSSRVALTKSLNLFNLPTTFSSGGQTKFNRVSQGYEKDHWIDAACVGITGACVYIAPSMTPLVIKATGRGSRQFCLMDQYGFPRTRAKKQKSVHGFKTGDLVKAIVPKGVKTGTYLGRVAIRHSGNFCINTGTEKTDGISYKHCKNIQRSDGYAYLQTKQKEEQRFPPVLKDEVSALSTG